MWFVFVIYILIYIYLYPRCLPGFPFLNHKWTFCFWVQICFYGVLCHALYSRLCLSLNCSNMSEHEKHWYRSVTSPFSSFLLSVHPKLSLGVTWLTGHLTLLSRERHLHLDAAADQEGKAKPWTSVTARSHADSHAASPTVFSPAIIWNSSFFLLFHSHTICLLRSLSSCRLVHVHFVLSYHRICVWGFFVSNSAS